MCGRFTLFASIPVLPKRFDAPVPGGLRGNNPLADDETCVAPQP
jgi:hypothetical protein